MVKKNGINWGILSTGEIASRMAKALEFVDDANLLAVASRSIEKAHEFSKKFNVPKYYQSYDELVQDPDVDLVYIGTPNICHYENILLCLNNGKNVVCEKPFTINHKQALELVKLAKEKNLFLMEAHKSYFLPGIKKIKELINSDTIGDIVSIKADFCFNPPPHIEYRIFDPNLGGGALLDVGGYLISFAIYLSGYPVEISSNSVIGKTGVDIFNEIELTHPSGSVSKLSCGINQSAPREAIITGTKGYIKVHEPFHQAPKLTVKSGENDSIEIDTSFNTSGLDFEARAVTDCLKMGETECSEFSLKNTLDVLKVMDCVRKNY